MFSWFSFLTYAIVTAVTPGPNNIMSMSNASRKGFHRALPFNLGIWAGFSIVMILCTIFCSMLSALIPKIKMPMLVIGAVYMLYLAWETLRSSDSIKENHSHDGCSCSLSTPKYISIALCPWKHIFSRFIADSFTLCLDSRCSLRLSALSLRYVGLPLALRSSGCFPNMQS